MLWGIVYGVGAVVVGFIAYRKVVWKMHEESGHVDGEGYVMAAFPALGAAAFWPLLVVAAPVCRWVRRDVEKNHPRAIEQRQEEAERELRRREAEIARLERELGIVAPEAPARRSYWTPPPRGLR